MTVTMAPIANATVFNGSSSPLISRLTNLQCILSNLGPNQYAAHIFLWCYYLVTLGTASLPKFSSSRRHRHLYSEKLDLNSIFLSTCCICYAFVSSVLTSWLIVNLL